MWNSWRGQNYFWTLASFAVVDGEASASAVVAQFVAAAEMNWLRPWGKSLSK
jgi:hypothetical protein